MQFVRVIIPALVASIIPALMATIFSALMATIVSATTAAEANTNTNIAMVPHVTLSLSPDAINVLTENGIWAPNLTAFALGEPNTAGVNYTAEAAKLAASRIEVDSLLRVSIKMGAAADSPKQVCDQCKICMKSCGATLIFWPVCTMICFAQPYCNNSVR